MRAVNAVILSGACCNPGLAGLDEKIQARIKEIANKKQLQVNISVVPISAAAFGGLGLGEKTDKAVRELVGGKGMSVLPVVIFDGAIAFYGGLASAGLIEEKLDLAAQPQQGEN